MNHLQAHGIRIKSQVCHNCICRRFLILSLCVSLICDIINFYRILSFFTAPWVTGCKIFLLDLIRHARHMAVIRPYHFANRNIGNCLQLLTLYIIYNKSFFRSNCNFTSVFTNRHICKLILFITCFCQNAFNLRPFFNIVHIELKLWSFINQIALIAGDSRCSVADNRFFQRKTWDNTSAVRINDKGIGMHILHNTVFSNKHNGTMCI